MKKGIRIALGVGAWLLIAGTAFAQAPATADYIDGFDGEFATVMVNRQPQFLHRSGKIMVDKVERIGYFHTVVAVKHDAYGAINNQGTIIAPFKYDEVNILDEKDKEHPEKNYCFITVRLNGKTGAVDSMGNVLCPIEYNEIDALTPRTFKVKQNGLYGFCDMKTGKLLQAPRYEDIHKSYVIDNVIEIKEQGRIGLALEDGTIIVPPGYKDFRGLGEEDTDLFSYFTTAGKCGLMNKQGKVVTEALYDDFSRGPSKELVGVTVQGKIGFLQTTDGVMKVPPQYTRTQRLGHILLVWKGNKCGVVDASGKEIIPVENDEIALLDAKGDGVYNAAPAAVTAANGPYCLLVKKAKTAALYNDTGKQLFPFEYTDIKILPYYGKTYVAVVKNGKCGLADLSGHLLLPAQFDGLSTERSQNGGYDDDYAGDDKNNFIGVMKGEKVGVYNVAAGKMVVPVRYSEIRWQNAEMLHLSAGDSSALADKSGNILRPMTPYGFYDAVAANRIVEKRYTNNEGNTLLTDKAGNILYENKYWEFNSNNYNRLLMPKDRKNSPLQFSNGLLKVRGYSRENLFVDSTGKPLVFEDYAYVGDFYNGLAVVGKKDDHYGIINAKKEEVYPVVLDDIASFEDELLQIKKDGKLGLLRKDGTMFLPIEYEDINRIYDTTFYVVTRNGKKGVLNAAGKEVLPLEYDEIRYNRGIQLFDVTKGDKNGMVDVYGKTVIPVVYDELDKNRDWGGDIFPLFVKQGEWYFYLDKDGKELPVKSKKKKGYDN
ncbi:WG repeat-containing protein [Chitinophaga sp. HK235]|uniref:WG repeat-containing protein n=1 Tax=Chitinophaga sp. HK235 TaxID=2952571 RepID=UPI001BAA59ED|nr:WG repeat-containing protein [Chitinophaga sp. HK235]